jgi:hypothetical protein
MSSQHPHGSLDNPGTVHEESDINVRAILWFVAVLALIVVVVDISMWGMFRVLAHMEATNDPYVTPLAPPPSPVAGAPPLGPPGLQTTPWTDLKQFRAEQNAFLHSYGWIDQPAGVARLPIEKAKELLLKQGLPVRPELADALEGTHVAATGESNGGRTLPAAQPDTSSRPPAPAAPSSPAKPGGGGHD